jgi:prepilin-type N-terminal cleavage/methylation domain-containing protein
MIPVQKHMRAQAGFTLVELAIVMIIIGLLIAGVLKGQELIANAKTTSTVAQLKAIDAAVSAFKDTYGALPGDLQTPANRMPNCGTACTAGAGNGDGNIDAANSYAAALGTEAKAFFPDLASANLVTNIIDNGTVGWGNDFLQAKIDTSGYIPGSVNTPSAANMPGSVAVLGTGSGLYVALMSVAAVPVAANTGLQPKQANSIDIKLDDGIPGAGNVIAIGTVGVAATNCASTATNAGIYVSSNATNVCALYIRIQG